VLNLPKQFALRNPRSMRPISSGSLSTFCYTCSAVDGDSDKLGGLFDREQYLKTFLLGAILERLFTTVASTSRRAPGQTEIQNPSAKSKPDRICCILIELKVAMSEPIFPLETVWR
jgi:hypothetical protein